jgi:hypothetical protein
MEPCPISHISIASRSFDEIQKWHHGGSGGGGNACGDMCAMPIWSETTKINTTKAKRSKMHEGLGQLVLLGPLTCKCDKKYSEYNEI